MGLSSATRDRVDTSHGPILYLEDITVSFDGFRALNKLSLTIDRGELRCLIGPNGAGKTTMMDVITGKTKPDHGTAFFGQTIDLLRLTETEIANKGSAESFKSRLFLRPIACVVTSSLLYRGDDRYGNVYSVGLVPSKLTVSMRC